MVARRELMHLVRRFGQESHGLAERFAESNGLHPTDLHALLAIIEAEEAGTPLQPVELAARLGRSSGSVSAALDRRERDGHVRRERRTSDRRRVDLRRSEAAQVVAGRFFGELAHRTDGLLDDFDDAELAAVERFLGGIVAVLEGYRAELTGGS